MKRILFSIVCIFLIPAIFAEAGISDNNANLIQTAEKGNLSAVQTVLIQGADVNAKNVNYVTALMMASDKGFIEIVKLLLDKGADVNATKENNVTALMIASDKGRIDIVKLLLQKGADVNFKKTH